MRIDLYRSVLRRLHYGVACRLAASNSRIGWWPRPLRRWAYTPLFDRAGRNVKFGARAFFGSSRQVEIGDKSSVRVAAQIYGPLLVGKNVMMGPEALVITTTQVADRIDIPMIEQGVTGPRPVVIEDDVWIGQRVTFLPGVRIGTGSIIGANAVVTSDVAPYPIVAGNPARVIRSRRRIGGISVES
jgi:maltose O-acetyltransferase